MSQDIFIPLSRTADAVVGPLDTVTWVTNNSHDLEDILINGYFQSTDGWYRPEKKELKRLNRYLGFNNELTWKIAKATNRRHHSACRCSSRSSASRSKASSNCSSRSLPFCRCSSYLSSAHQ